MEDSLLSSIAGAAFGAVVTIILCIIVPQCTMPELPDPHEGGFIEIQKMPADGPVVFPADRSFFWFGEKRGIGTASGEPRS
jgi:hypothetical protein